MTFTQWSWDGHYEMYLPSGQYSMRVFPWTLQGNVAYNATSSVIEINPGESSTGIDFTVGRSEIPLQDSDSNLIFTVLAFATVTDGRMVLLPLRRVKRTATVRRVLLCSRSF